MSAALESLLSAAQRADCAMNDEAMRTATHAYLSERRARLTVTRTGIAIGAAYVPPPQTPGSEAVRIQAALLESRTARPLTVLRRLFGYLRSRA